MNCEIFIFLCFFPFFWEEKVADDDVKKEKVRGVWEGTVSNGFYLLCSVQIQNLRNC